MRAVRLGAIAIIALIIVSSSASMQVTDSIVAEDALQRGPYVDKITYKIAESQDNRMLALQAGEIEMDTSFFDPVWLPTLDADPDIGIFQAVRNGYGQITINCRDYPLNISGLRRAFAFAFDKTRVTAEIMDGFSLEHDSLVPYPNGWCIEDDLPWHYYTARPDIGNAILDDLGFDIDPVSGYRNAPSGQPFDIEIEYPDDVVSVGSGPALIGVDALTSLHINARVLGAGSCDIITRLDSHGNYDMVSYYGALNFYSNDVDWLAYEFWSEYANTSHENPSNFANDTYDSWREQLLHGTTYDEVYEAAANMQLILHENVPRLVTYENTYMQAYRNDQFTGHVEDLGRHISGLWTMRKIHKTDGTWGGNVSIAISEDPDSFNIYVTNSAYSAIILEELWPSLYSYGPDLNPYPDLAESMITETHADNAAVPEGHTRYTIDITHNATWSDGTPLTAGDVAFTFIYALESSAYGNPALDELESFYAAYAPSTYRFVIEFSTESYWHFPKFAFTPIIPKHIFNDVDGIGYEDWDKWNPILDPEDPFVTCGPFLFNNCVSGVSYELVKNPLFYYRVEEINTSDTTIVDHGTLAISYAIGSSLGFVIVVFSYLTYVELEKKLPKLKETPCDEVSEDINNLSEKQ